MWLDRVYERVAIILIRFVKTEIHLAFINVFMLVNKLKDKMRVVCCYPKNTIAIK